MVQNFAVLTIGKKDSIKFILLTALAQIVAGIASGLIWSPSLHMISKFPNDDREYALRKVDFFSLFGAILGPFIMQFSSTLKQIWIYHKFAMIAAFVFPFLAFAFRRIGKVQEAEKLRQVKNGLYDLEDEAERYLKPYSIS